MQRLFQVIVCVIVTLCFLVSCGDKVERFSIETIEIINEILDDEAEINPEETNKNVQNDKKPLDLSIDIGDEFPIEFSWDEDYSGENLKEIDISFGDEIVIPLYIRNNANYPCRISLYNDKSSYSQYYIEDRFFVLEESEEKVVSVVVRTFIENIKVTDVGVGAGSVTKNSRKYNYFSTVNTPEDKYINLKITRTDIKEYETVWTYDFISTGSGFGYKVIKASDVVILQNICGYNERPINLIALDPKTGEKIWELLSITKTEKEVLLDGLKIEAYWIIDDKIIVSKYLEDFYGDYYDPKRPRKHLALDIKTGKELDITEAECDEMIIKSNNAGYSSSGYDNNFEFHDELKKIIKNIQVNNEFGIISFVNLTDKFIFTTTDGRLLSYSYAGEKISELKLGDESHFSGKLVYRDENLYLKKGYLKQVLNEYCMLSNEINDQDNFTNGYYLVDLDSISKLDPQTLEPIWEVKSDEDDMANRMDWSIDSGYMIVFMDQSRKDKIIAVDIESGEIVWEVNQTERFWRWFFDSGIALVLTGEKIFIAVDAQTGEEIWRKEYKLGNLENLYINNGVIELIASGSELIDDVYEKRTVFENIDLRTGETTDSIARKYSIVEEGLLVSDDGYFINDSQWIDPETYEILGFNISSDGTSNEKIINIIDGNLYYISQPDDYRSGKATLVCKRIELP